VGGKEGTPSLGNTSPKEARPARMKTGSANTPKWCRQPSRDVKARAKERVVEEQLRPRAFLKTDIEWNSSEFCGGVWVVCWWVCGGGGGVQVSQVVLALLPLEEEPMRPNISWRKRGTDEWPVTVNKPDDQYREKRELIGLWPGGQETGHG